MADWTTISSLATGGGTLVLAIATFAAVRSSNRSARIAEQALQEQRRPVLVQARLDDPVQKAMFIDGHWARVEGSQAAVDRRNGAIYLGLALRNVGAGIAVLQGWYPWGELMTSARPHAPVEDFRRQTRDIYIPPGDVGMWQGALRDAEDEAHRLVTQAASERQPFSLDLLYTDQVGDQRTITRFTVTPIGEDRWLGGVGLHWNLDLPGPGRHE